MVATTGDPADPVITHTSKARGAELTSSYEEEIAALILALDWARANCPTERISICSDSQSILKATQSGAHDTQSIRQRLDNREGPTTLIWVPGHKGIPGNEAADELAKAVATATDTPPRPISFAIAKAIIRCTATDNRPRTSMVYENISWKADCIATSNRADAVLLARLRAGHTLLRKAYAHLLDPAADPTCPLCKEEPQTLEHWLQRCPNRDVLRQHTFGSPSPPLGVLTNDPEKVLALARATF